ncbi:MAG: IS5 family transposase [Candidatus Moraniibacteriota bacterium]|nr:MAG: IS5 family transposase [Candidatus Moranbacteria bacterium]QQS16096.1 MAG: IS5 family transposase [Candidatus Moranbacteria bacterium]
MYPSDITREQFEHIRPFLESTRKRTKPKTLDSYDVFNALLYILVTGCQWRALPKDYPKWQSVYRHFLVWKERKNKQTESMLEQVLKKIVEQERMKNGKQCKTSFCIVDAQSVKNTDTAREKGYDAGKKVSGIKRHILVDTNGLPHAFTVTTANVTDRNGAIQAVKANKKHLSRVEKLLTDGSYTGENFAKAIKACIGAEVGVAKRNELHTFAVLPQRWVVERSFSWLEKCRRLWKNCERTLDSSLQMMVLSFARLLLKRL